MVKQNNNKRRGIEIENRAKKELVLEGFTPLHCRGSLGCVDIVAFNWVRTRFINVKRVKLKNYSFYQEIQMIHNIEFPPNTSVELWVWLDRIIGLRKGGWKKFLIKEGNKNIALVRISNGYAENMK
jgi:hypothetical protein